jgi:hypothetical protein
MVSPQFSCGAAHDGDVGNLGMRGEDALDLRGVDVLCTGDDHVLDPLLEVQIAHDRRGLRRRGAASCPRPRLSTGLVPVAGHDRLGADLELAGAAPARVRASGGVDHPDGAVR